MIHESKYALWGMAMALIKTWVLPFWETVGTLVWEGLSMGFAGAVGGYLFSLIKKKFLMKNTGVEK
ncbi:hypothetical protein FUAX_41910 (plasmid) [Fulvitalea axinellae]|uniref:Holin n=1 Tax=Fulvitalea axinellae TaxID=1182444 RepID=A0AAU9CHX0_9BACT|nr:hypothetical protein FUAX_41910 [Fulvitalea axinellae]